MSFDAVNYAELRRLADSVQQAAQKVDSGRNEAAGHKAEVLAAMSGKLKFVEFRTSGYFYPSAKLLANGGQVFILAVGGGQGGARAGIGGAGGGVRFEIGGVGGPTSVIIGAGGNGQTSAYQSQATGGGDTSFGNLLTMGGRQFRSPTGVGDPAPRGSAAGRAFGVNGYGGPGGAGGLGSSGTGNATQPGADGVIGGLAMGNSSTGDYGNVAPGDPGYSGGGAGGTGVAGSATRGGHGAPNSGGGGGGGGSSGIGQHADGGNGGSGFVRVWWYE